ncbi:reverse transcriptase domain-containing protein [Tanacetum coccineum]
MEEIVNKFIEEGKLEHEEMDAFIREFRTTNELLLKERNNSLSELEFEEKEEAQQRKFLENLKQLHISIPFTEALAQMPKYAKFLKGLLSNKARLEEACTVTMNETCSTVLLNKLPSKEKDPGSFTIPCDIRDLHIDNALADLGASISLMPYTMYEKLGLGEPTRMSLELADRSIQYLWEIAKDVLIKIDKFILPIDFVILDMREDSRIPIILGRPFLATARAMIDVFNKKITLRVGSEEVIFDVDQSMKKPRTEDDECYGIDDLDTVIQSTTQELLENEHRNKNLEDGINRPDSENRFFQIPIAPEKREKTTFTCLYGTFAYRMMPQEDVVRIMQHSGNFSKMHDDQMLVRCEETNLVLNWEKCHFMVNEGTVLGHKISGKGTKVDKAKIDVITKLPYPTNVKGVRSFLGHASDFVVGAVLGQRIERKFKPIYYASKTLNDAQAHYTTTEKELLAVVFSFDKFRPYLILSKIMVYTDHSALKFYLANRMPNQGLSDGLENPNIGELAEEEIEDKFPDEHLMILKTKLNDEEPWYADYVNYIVRKVVPPEWTPEKKKRFFSQVKNYFWDEPYAFRLCPNNVMRRCVAGSEILVILAHCHSGPTGGHHSASVTGQKVYEAGFYWPSIFRDAKDYVTKCDACQKSGNISSRNKMPQNNIQVCEVFAIWGLDFMGPFPDSRGNKYILVALDTCLNGLKHQALLQMKLVVVVKFLKGLFSRFGVPKALISDKGAHFCNSQLEKDLLRYGVTHRISTAYHPQNNGQTEVTNRAIKHILERSVGYNPKDWSEKLNDALWVFKTAYKTPTRCTLFRMVYRKACHLPVEIEHKAYWLRDGSYENTQIYKERTKKWHDSRLRGDKDFKNGDKVLLFNSRLKLHPKKLESNWTGPFVVKTMYPYGAVEITNNNGLSFKVNEHRLKKYHDRNLNTDDNEFIELDT